MKPKLTKEQLANTKKQAWSAFFSSGQTITATVIHWLNELPKDDKTSILFDMEHPKVEEAENG